MINVNEKVTCRNPETGQVLTVGAKVFHSIYIDKGFELVTRDNVETGASGHGRRGNGRESKPKAEPESVQTGSAAGIAAGLGLTHEPEGSSGSVADNLPPATGGVSAKDQRQKSPATNAEPGVNAEQKKAEFSTGAIGAADLPGAKNNIDGNDANTDGEGASAERESNRRDRGRG